MLRAPSKGPIEEPLTDLLTAGKKGRLKFSHTTQCIRKTWVFFLFFMLKKKCHNFKSKSTLQWGELFYFITKRRSLYVVRKYKIDLFLFLWNAAVQTARVNCLSSRLEPHHIHLGMDVLGCWKSGPLVHRATKSPDQQFQNVPFSYIASMHTS